MWGISSQAQELLAFHEGFRSTELVLQHVHSS
jgi:hypothetical protein